MKKLITTTALALSLALPSTMIPTKQAHAGIVIGCATATIIGPLIGLTMSAGAFFWGIQEEGLSWPVATLFVLDEKLDGQNIENALSARYPDLDSFIVRDLSEMILVKAQEKKADERGLKDITFSENELSSILEIVQMNDASLAAQLKQDLTISTLN
jgi:hypothetical protein